MKKNLIIIFLLLGMVLMIPIPGFNAPVKATGAVIENAMVWKRTDIVLTSETEYENP